MTIELFADLVTDFRSALAERFGREPMALNPPITSEERRQAETAVGLGLPDQLVDLLNVANGISMFSRFDIGTGPDATWIQMFTEQTRETITLLKQSNYDYEANGHWEGEPAQSDYIMFDHFASTRVGVEVGGPLDGRVFVFEGAGESGSTCCWGRIGDDIESVLRWPLELAQQTETYGDSFELTADDVIQFRHLGGEVNFVSLIDRIRPVIARHGGTPAAFAEYDQPEGYRPPSVL